jgi:hypothetical protein
MPKDDLGPQYRLIPPAEVLRAINRGIGIRFPELIGKTAEILYTEKGILVREMPEGTK